MQSQYQLLITSSSWEARSTSLVQKLLPNIACEHSIILRYTPTRAPDLAHQESIHHRVITHQLERYGSEIHSLSVELWNPQTGLRALDTELRKLFIRPEHLRILLDVTTLTKAYTLVFLRYLGEVAKENDVSIFFTDLRQPQSGLPSRGITDVITLPLYGGCYIQGRENLLITVVGFEPDRVIGLWEKLEPHKTVPLYSLRRDGENPLEINAFRDRFLGRPGVDAPIEIPTNPLQLAGILSQIYLEFNNEYNVAISATGNKLQCIGMYLFTRLHDANVQVFYPVPERYAPKYWNPFRIAGDSMIMKLSDVFQTERL